MSNENMSVEVNDNDGIVIKINPYELWEMLPDYEKESVLNDSAPWDIVEDSLKYNIGRGVSSPVFNNSIHKLRELILTDSEFVSDIAVSFVGTLARMLMTQIQKEREASAAYWRLYHAVGRRDGVEGIKSPDRIRITDDEIREKVLSILGER